MTEVDAEINGQDMLDFAAITVKLEELNINGSDWEDLMHVCFLSAAYCAAEAGIDADEFMYVVKSIRVADEGIYGDA
jgi:hypothetical protein